MNSAFVFSEQTAFLIARSDACKILTLSMVSLSIIPTEHRAFEAAISSKSSSRLWGVSFFESSSPSMNIPAGRITAAASTGPARGPRPASSTPAIR